MLEAKNKFICEEKLLLSLQDETKFLEDKEISKNAQKIIELCNQYMSQGWRHFKIKVGLDLNTDVKRLDLIRRTIGSDCSII